MANGGIWPRGYGSGYVAIFAILNTIVTSRTQRTSRLQKGLSLEPDDPPLADSSVAHHGGTVVADQTSDAVDNAADSDPFMPGGYPESFEFIMETPARPASHEGHSLSEGSSVTADGHTVSFKL